MRAKLGLIWITLIFLITFPIGNVFSQRTTTRTTEDVSDTGIVDILTQIVPQPPGSYITAIPGQNKIVVRNTPTNLKKIQNFIEELGTPPQVSIEAKFVVVGEETYKDLGLEWTSFSFNWANPIGRTQRDSGIAGQAWTYDTISGSLTSGASIIPPPHVSGGGLQIAYSSTNYPQIAATLYMLSTRSDTKFLSAPTITTLNNEPAVVRFVKTINYFEDVEIDTETDDVTNITTTNYDWTFTSRDIGIILYVSPTVIKPTKSVRLFLQPVVSDIEGEDVFTWVLHTGLIFYAALPRFLSIDETTNVNVRDGATIVLGGLMSENTTAILSKVPFLGDIPVIGKAFFQRQTKGVEKQHLLIFITVNVLDSQGNPYFARG